MLTLIAIAIVWLNAINIANWFNGTTYLNHYKDLSQIGDIFGVVSSLFSALSVFGIIITIIIQNNDLKATRNEFILKRITELIYNQIGYIDKTMMKLKYANISVVRNTTNNENNPFPIEFQNIIDIEIVETNGIEGIYKFINNFSSNIYPFDINNMIFDSKNRNEIDCFNNNIVSSSILMEVIIRSIEIIKPMFNNINLSSQKEDILIIFKTNIGQEIFNYLEIIGQICKIIKDEPIDKNIPLHLSDIEAANKLYVQYEKYILELAYINVKI